MSPPSVSCASCYRTHVPLYVQCLRCLSTDVQCAPPHRYFWRFLVTEQSEPIAQAKLRWYRVPVERATLAELNQRSDAWGLAQTLGHLGIIVATGALSWYASQHWSWYILIGCLFLHGTVYAFL